MSFKFINMSQDIRNKMLEEVDLDIKKSNLYYSTRFSSVGRSHYPILLNESIKDQNEQWLAEQLKRKNAFNTLELRQGKSVKVPVSAAQTFSEGEFNRFYMRAICIIAIANNKLVRVYRAQEVASARSASAEKIGQVLDPTQLLQDLRSHIGVDTSLGLPPGPNSGLSVHID